MSHDKSGAGWLADSPFDVHSIQNSAVFQIPGAKDGHH